MVSNQTIQINEIQNSIMDSKQFFLLNNESQVKDTPTLNLDSTQITIKKVIVLILLI